VRLLRYARNDNIIPMPEYEPYDETGGGFDERPTPPPLNKNQKIAAAGLAVFAVLIIVLWAAQLRNNIYGPFNSGTAGNLATTEATDQTEALKNKDTDSDGLSDYEELYVQKTSPYLADTDSDGLSDSAEIKNNTDPNCPQGRTCATGLVEETGGANNTASGTLNSLLDQFGMSGQQTSGTTNLPAGQAGLNSDQVNALKNIDAASLRQLLIQAGMPQATLDKISDADLMKSYGETFSGQ